MAKICMLLNNAFHPDLRVYKEARYLIEQGHLVTILALDRKNEMLDRPKETIDGIEVVRIYCRDPKTSEKLAKSKLMQKFKKVVYLFWFRDFIRQAKAYLRENDFDYLHCHDWHDIIAGVHARKKGCPLIFDMHEYYEHQLARNGFTRRCFRILIGHYQNKSDKIIYVHPIQSTTMSKKNREKLVFLPNYPDGKIFFPVQHTESDILRVAYVGYVRGNIKCYENLIAACRSGAFVFQVYGAGALYEPVKELSQGMERVKLYGRFQIEQDFERIYSNMDLLYIFPEEGAPWIQPTKFFEALRSGTPYIAQKGTYLADFAEENGVGFSVDMYQEEAVKALMGQLAENRSLIDQARECIKKFSGDYDWNQVVKNLDEIYH